MKTTVANFFLGLDISKGSFHAALQMAGRSQCMEHSFTNEAQGFKQLERWLRALGVPPKQVHACMEATSRYGEALAESLHAYLGSVSMVNPRLVKHYAKACNLRAKSDSADARLLAQFCAERHPRPWTPPLEERRMLQEMTRRLGQLRAAQNAEYNRLESVRTEVVRRDVQQHIAELQERLDELQEAVARHIAAHRTLREQEQLLRSIPGIGAKTAAVLLSELPAHLQQHYGSARQLAAHSGLTPRHHQSGKHAAPTPVCRIGSSRLRASLYMSALVGSRCQAFAAFRARLIARGKKPKQAICALMRKLIHIVFGVLKNQQPFNPNMLVPS